MLLAPQCYYHLVAFLSLKFIRSSLITQSITYCLTWHSLSFLNESIVWLTVFLPQFLSSYWEISTQVLLCPYELSQSTQIPWPACSFFPSCTQRWTSLGISHKCSTFMFVNSQIPSFDHIIFTFHGSSCLKMPPHYPLKSLPGLHPCSTVHSSFLDLKPWWTSSIHTQSLAIFSSCHSYFAKPSLGLLLHRLPTPLLHLSLCQVSPCSCPSFIQSPEASS